MKKISTDHHEIRLKVDDMFETEKNASIIDEPFSDSSNPTYL